MTPKRHTYGRVLRAIYKFTGYRHNGIYLNGYRVDIHLKRTRKKGVCPKCKKRCGLLSESIKRTIRDLDTGDREVWITFFKHRIHCECGFNGFEFVNFHRPRKRCTIRLEQLVFDKCQTATIKDVSHETGLNWKTVKEIDKDYIRMNIEGLKKIHPERIGIDEIAYRKGHKYLTVVRDLDLGAVIWVGVGRKAETLDVFFQRIGPLKQREISVVVTDMWDPYLKSIRKHCPQADLVIDKFHIIKMVNEALDTIRKREFANASDTERRYYKRKRFVILRRRRTLNDRQEEALYDLMARNETLFQAYLLKEQVSDIFDEESPIEAWQRLNGWARNVKFSGLIPFKNVVKTMKRYYRGIFNYFKHQVTNAQAEGFNTKINIIRRKAYGFRDLEYFMLKILQACGVMRLGGTRNGR